ncbi:MAG TPA: hypothetical protein VFR04_06520 [Solirubrobacterales bacterium]|nr:hypothetical protein [Solirubrobacterales bacterium]
MRRRLLLSLCIAALVLLGAGLAHGELRQTGNVRISFSGGFTPRSLPRDRLAPITVHVKGAIGTTDGSHPPPIRRVEVALNRNGKLTTEGLPTCAATQLQSTSSETALARCRPSLIGRGRFGAEVEFPGTAPFPAKGPALVFYGIRRGHPAMLIHLYITAPVHATFVLALAISQPEKGTFGTVLTATIPSLAGGLGSVTEIDLTIGRTYRYRGERRSFLSASCAAPPGFSGGSFSLARGSFFFADGKKIETTLTRNCNVR